jgi:hypothetical protein
VAYVCNQALGRLKQEYHRFEPSLNYIVRLCPKKKKKKKRKRTRGWGEGKKGGAGRQWLIPVILASQEAKITRIAVQSQ